MNNFWEERYKAGGNSGAGSYGEYAEHKAEVINNYIEKFDIGTISDFGCGDGNQTTLLKGFNAYTGFDISPYVIEICRRKFKDNASVNFCTVMSELPESDMCISLDVLYHILDEKDYNDYLTLLFSKSKKYVLIFSSNHARNPEGASHIFHRKFTDWVEENAKDFKLIEETSNMLQTSAQFFLYEKI